MGHAEKTVTLKPSYYVSVLSFGKSRLLYIPMDIVRLFDIDAGDIAEIRVDERGRKIVVKFMKPREVGVEE